MLQTLDWIFIAGYFVIATGIAIYFARQASKDTGSFFLSGRSMPWWLAGTSMVATTFAADTPLAITELVSSNGISGNWLWWNAALGGILTVFFFAKLWRRSGVMTDVEFVELRYSGKAAAWLRGIKAIFFGLLMNGIVLGWVSLAMETVIKVLFPDLTVFGYTTFMFLGTEISAAMVVVGALIVIVGFYSLLAGLMGVAVTDVFQFAVAMVGSVFLVYYALTAPEVGGVSGIMEKLPASTFNFFPTVGDVAEGAGVLVLSISAFVAYLGVQWWSSWYPGAEPGGGGYVAQRMLSAKTEKDSVYATLWFTIAHYCVRPWPWILVALASLVLYPDLIEAREGYVMVMRDVLPAGVLGLLVAAFLAAFMSTVSTQLNWGASYIINDVWERFVAPGRDPKYYVLVSRIFTFLLAIFGFWVTTQLDTIKDAWGLILTASAGLGLVLILRWYWWRVSAWSELTATLIPVILVILHAFGVPIPGLEAEFPDNMFTIVLITTIAWIGMTFLMPATDEHILRHFYRKVAPAGGGWKPIKKLEPTVIPEDDILSLVKKWIAGVVLVYSVLFSSGNFIFSAGPDNYERLMMGTLCLALALMAGLYLHHSMKKGV